jgi:outer membrane lipoprotein-sorting protein
MKILYRALCVLTVAAAANAQSVDAVLDRMDKAAPLFHAVSADVSMLEFNALLNSSTTQTGTFQMQRLKPGNVRAILDFTGGQGDARTIGFFGKKLRIYYPKLNAYQDFDMGKNGDVVNQYLLLGFGSSGKDLAQSYTINFLGVEKVAGQDTSKLELHPKDPAVQQKLQKIWMWVPNDGANPVQQQFDEPSGNYRKLTYTGIKLNPQIKGTLELHLPSGAKKEG